MSMAEDMEPSFEEYMNDFGESCTPYDESNKTWMTNTGSEIKLEEIELDHLYNIIGWLRKKDLEVHQDILDELKKRTK